MSGIKLQAPEVLTDDLRELALDVIENGLGTAIAHWVNEELMEGSLTGVLPTRKGERTTALTFYDDEDRATDIGQRQIIEAMVKIANGDVRIRGDIKRTIIDMLTAGDYCGEHGVGGDEETDDVIIQVALYGEICFE